ncbi:hypothetical protein K449DRAFT_428494 [Hypoxylon sp. EC38]|nr:hypothetical protein K449DRAFT_428494 [Hypoxylon sp. EC38]
MSRYEARKKESKPAANHGAYCYAAWQWVASTRVSCRDVCACSRARRRFPFTARPSLTFVSGWKESRLTLLTITQRIGDDDDAILVRYLYGSWVLGYRGVGLLANVEKETGAKRDANSLPMRFEKGKRGKGAAIEFSTPGLRQMFSISYCIHFQNIGDCAPLAQPH